MTKKKSLKAFLATNGEVIISDGGMTTSLYDKGFYINRSFEELSLTNPEDVKEVTRLFRKAGAQLLHTNTFNANRLKLTAYGLQEQQKEMLLAACEITSEAVDEGSYSLAAFGPLGAMLEPLGKMSEQEAKGHFKECIEIINETDVDGISFLSFHDLKELELAIEAAQEVSKKPIFAHVGIQESMKTSYGHTLDEYIALCEKLSVDVIGLSGEVGPSGMLTALQKIRAKTSKPLMISPNAGLPRYVNDEYIYMCNPDYMGKYAKRFAQAGANVIGGHSGVSDKHIKAIFNSVRMVGSSSDMDKSFQHSIPESIQEVVDQPKQEAPLEERSLLGKKLKAGEKVITVEINPPRGVDCSQFFERCAELEQGGVEFVNIPDGARAMARMSSLQLASYVSSRFKLEAIPHFTSRDRNLLGLQSDLLGAYVNGVKNLLLVTGDPPKLGNCPGATAVYDVDAIGMTHIVTRFNQGLDLGGSNFGTPTEFVHGVALNPTAKNQDLEIKRFKYKMEAGATYAITQPIYDVEAYQEFFEKLGSSSIPIIMGIWPLVSLRNAEFLKNEVPGVSVPDWAVDKMRAAGDSKEKALAVGVEIALETMEQAKHLVAGFQVSAPFNRVDVALDVIKNTNLK